MRQNKNLCAKVRSYKTQPLLTPTAAARMQLERIIGGAPLARALGIPCDAHVMHNQCLIGATTLSEGSGVTSGRVPPEPCADFYAYYQTNHTDKGLRVGSVVRGGFGSLYPDTHEMADHAKQKRLTVVQSNHNQGVDLREWSAQVPGFAKVEDAARRIGEYAFPEHKHGLYATAWHIIEQPFGAGDSTSFGAHTDDAEEPLAVVTVVVKLTNGWSRMAVEGAMQSFAYAWEAGGAGAFDARCWHRSVPIRESDPTALKVAFFYAARRSHLRGR